MEAQGLRFTQIPQEVVMQKISGILSASPRVTSVDMKEAPPVRPGMPGFGRPEGASSLRERVSAVDSLRKSRELQDELLGVRSKESQQAELVQNLSDRFFARQTREADTSIADGPSGALVVLPTEIAEGTPSRPSNANYDDVTASLREPMPDPDQLYPKGSFIDKVA
jgi:hypothetical protein